MPQNTTDQFLQQHISYNFYLQKCLAYHAATALTNSSVPSTLWVVALERWHSVLRWGVGVGPSLACPQPPWWFSASSASCPRGVSQGIRATCGSPGSLVEQVALQGRGQGQDRNVA